ncbi:MAG: MMPL family transporter [bacterium]
MRQGDFLGDLLASWARVQVRFPRVALLGVLLVTLGAAAGLTQFEIDPDVSSLLPADAPAAELFEATQVGVTAARTLFLSLEAEDLEALMPSLVESLEESPLLIEVVATRSALAAKSTRQSARAPLWWLSVEALAQLEERLSSEGRRAAIAATGELLALDPLLGSQVARNDPLGVRWIFAAATAKSLPSAFDANSSYLMLKGGRRAFVRVTGREHAFNVDFSERLLADLGERCAAVELSAVGGYAIAVEDSRRIRGDLISSLRWSIPLLLLFFLISTRSWLLPHLYLLPTALAVFWTLGYGALLFGPMTPLAISAAAILCGLGVDFSIHYLGRFREHRARSSLSDALEATHRTTARSLCGCWLTSSVAFMALALGSFAGLKSLGLLLALGLTLAMFSTWTTLPLLLRAAPRLPAPGPPGPLPRFFAELARSNRAGLASGALILLALAGWSVCAWRGLSFDADPALLRPTESEVSRSLKSLEDDLGFAPSGVTLLLDSQHSPGKLVDAARELEAQGVVAHSDAARLVRYSSERRERVASFRERTAGWFEGALADLDAAGFQSESLRGGLENLARKLAADPEPERVEGVLLEWRDAEYWRASFHSPHSLRTRAQRENYRNRLQAAVAAPTKIMDPGALGDALGPVLAAELSVSFKAVALLVLLLILASVGRWRAGLIAMAPVVFGLGIVLGGFSLFGWVIHPGNLLAFPLIFGLGVDDGLHMVHRSLSAGADAARSTGVDVWRTSVTTAVGFGSLMTAQSPAIASLGAVVLVGTVACYVTSVVLIPWLMHSNTP